MHHIRLRNQNYERLICKNYWKSCRTGDHYRNHISKKNSVVSNRFIVYSKLSLRFSADAVMPPKTSKSPGLKIFHRHHFSSAMKRMTVVAGYTLPGHSEPKLFVAVKGAPEVLKDMVSNVVNPSFYSVLCPVNFRKLVNNKVVVMEKSRSLVEYIFQYTDLPSDYVETYMTLTRQGARVLAMGIKELTQTKSSEVIFVVL